MMKCEHFKKDVSISKLRNGRIIVVVRCSKCRALLGEAYLLNEILLNENDINNIIEKWRKNCEDIFVYEK